MDVFKRLVTPQAQPAAYSPIFEVNLKDDCGTSLKFVCTDNIPGIIPVVPWCSVTTEDKDPPNDKPFVLMVDLDEASSSPTLKDRHSKYKKFKNLKVVVLLGNIQKDWMKEISSDFLLLFVPLQKKEIVRALFQSSNSQCQLSSIPLLNFESKIQESEYTDQEKHLSKLFAVIRESVRDGVIMSKACRNNSASQRLLCEIMHLGERAMDTEFASNSLLKTRDAELIIQTLMKRENLLYYFTQDFAAYVVIFEWVFRFCNFNVLPALFKTFLSTSAYDLKTELDSFASLPDVGLDSKFGGTTESMKFRVADNLLKLLENHSKQRHVSTENAHQEIFIAVSIGIKLYVSSNNSEKTKTIWQQHYINKLNSTQLSLTMMKDLRDGLQYMNVFLKGLECQFMFGWSELFKVLSNNPYHLSFIHSGLDLLSEHLVTDGKEHSFLCSFFNPLVNHFDSLLSKYGPNGVLKMYAMSFTKMVNEGLNLIDYIISLSDNQFWDFRNVFTVVDKFLDFLVALINLRDKKAIKHVTDLTTRQGVYGSQMSTKILASFKNVHDELRIADFVALFKAGNFKCNELIENHMKMCKTPSSLCDPGVIDFIELCRCNFVSPWEQSQLFEFICWVCKKYSSQKQMLIDLVKLKPDPARWFLEMTESLEKFCDDCFLKSDSKELLPSILLEIMSHLPNEYSYYHEAYAKYLLKKFSESYHSHMQASIDSLLTKSCSILKPVNRDSHEKASICISFSLRVLNEIAKFTQIEENSFLWLKKYGKTIVLIVEGHLLSNELTTSNSMLHLEKTVGDLKAAINYVTKCAIQKALTFTELEQLIEHYEHYKAIWGFFAFSDNAVELKFLDSSKVLYDSCVKIINSLLIRSHKSYLLCTVTTLPALMKHGIDIPKSLSLKIETSLSLKCTENDRKYRPDKIARVCDLESLTNELTEYLSPIEKSLDTLLFVAKYESYILYHCIEFYKKRVEYFTTLPDCVSHVSSEMQNVVKLNHIIQLTEECMFRLREGSNSFTEILSILTLEFLNNEQKVHDELKHITNYLEMKNETNTTARIYECLQAVVILLDITEDLDTLYKTCKMFGLASCLEDPKMVEMQAVFNELSSQELHNDISLNSGVSKLNTIKMNLGVSDIKNTLIFKLVSAIKECPCLYRFCRLRGFNSVEGYQSFISQHKLVTIAMDKEDYCEEILNQLRGAMLFMSPFFNKDSNLIQLMTQLKSLTNVPVGISQLMDVEANMDTIELSFNKIEGETHELVMTTLKAVIKTGHFLLCSSDQDNVHLYLEFRPLCQEYSKIPCLRWDLEKIEKFSRKLTFFNSEKGAGIDQKDEEHFCWFIKRFDEARSLQLSYASLQRMGHQQYRYLHENRIFSLGVEGEAKLHTELCKVKKTLKEFECLTEKARVNCKELSLIPLPKMRVIHEKLSKNHCDVDSCINDIGMFFGFPLTDRIRNIIEITSKEFFTSSLFDANLNPAEITGKFLTFILPKVPVGIKALSLNVETIRRQASAFRLYTAINFNNLDLVCMIFWIFGEKIPFKFQLLRCSAATTREELFLFFQRINAYPNFKYLIMGINTLTMEVQQVLITLCSKMRFDVISGLHDFRMPDVCFVEYAASVFQNMPWMTVARVDEKLTISPKKVQDICSQVFNDRFKVFRVVKGMQGSGKTHYIHKNMKSDFHDDYIVCSIDESFNKINCIQQFQAIPRHQNNLAIYLNVSLILSKDDNEGKFFLSLADEIHWFFFDFFILGYADDYNTGLSLRFPESVARSVYVEVPFWDIAKKNSSKEEQLKQSYETFCKIFPAFHLPGKTCDPMEYIDLTDPGIHLVCKYLLRYKNAKLDELIDPRKQKPIKISEDPAVSPEVCYSLLAEYIPSNLTNEKKVLEKLYLKYLERRCIFMENCPQLMFNSGFKNKKGLDTTRMRSILFKIMLEEVKVFCKKRMTWNDINSQLIYNFTDGGASFSFISCNPTELKQEERYDLEAIGVKLPSGIEMNSPKRLHEYLSTALGVRLNKNNELDVIKETKYVLTKDFTLKMLNIHERKECGMPVIIEGETGVGKTFLLEVLSLLWNESWKQHVRLQRDILKDILKETFENDVHATLRECDDPTEVQELLECDDARIPVEKWIPVLSMLCNDMKPFYQKIHHKLKFLWNDPSLACLEMPHAANCHSDLGDIFESYDKTGKIKQFALVLNGILQGKPKSCFYKLNVHSATTPEEVIVFFNEVIHLAVVLKSKYEKSPQNKLYQKPIITVFLDEINTASCPGFLKQIIIDRTLNNFPIPDNVFIVAACNPYRGNSLILLTNKESNDEWLRPSYYVQPLAPTLELLKWDYGALRKEDEKEYVKAKMRLCYTDSFDKDVAAISELGFLSDLIHQGQSLVRQYASEQLEQRGLNHEVAESYATCCVSQRDIQRVFVLYEWLLHWFNDVSGHYQDETEFKRKVRAVFVSIGIAYYFRLNSDYRKRFKEEMNKIKKIGREGVPVTFSNALQQELDLTVEKFKLPLRIAATEALKENIYATVVCILNMIPLIIVGPPGSSKTLSFKIVSSNLQGVNSMSEAFQNETVFPPIDQHSYQCSRRSTSNEIEAVFKRAIRRKKMLEEVGIANCSVIVMDEAGLTEESHESLKVLHYYLDDSKVSFVGLSNHILDAAKTNRAISLYRTESTLEDLKKIASTLFPSMANSSSTPISNKPSIPPPEESLVFIERFLRIYIKRMNDPFRRFYGIRDVVHFLLYLYRKKEIDKVLSPKSVVEALERNFNGKKDILDSIIKIFLKEMDVDPLKIRRRDDLEIFKTSLRDLPMDLNVECQVRYKLIIDSSEDDSLTAMLFAFGTLKRNSTTILVCTKFPGDPDSEKMNTIASLRYLAAHGSTVVLLNCEDVQESFYDLFNQNFSSIDQSDGKKLYYANIALGAQMKMCFVDPKFQCIVVLKQKHVEHTPGPYLNRFEKYCFTHKSILDDMMLSIPKQIVSLVHEVKENINRFIDSHEGGIFYGFCEETISSLILTSFKSVLQQPLDYSKIDLPSDSKVALLLKSIFSCSTKLPICFTSIDPSVFEDDVIYINEMLALHDEELHTTLENLDPSQITSVVSKTLEFFMEESDKDVNLTPEAKLIRFCLKNWLELSLSRKLLQIMKPEALVTHNHILPAYYKRNYLKEQVHFSLPGLIKVLVKRLNHRTKNMVDKSVHIVNKVICYTHTSHFIQELLPLYYTRWESDISKEHKTALEKFFDLELENIDLESFYIYSLTNATASQEIQSILKKFYLYSNADVLLFVADMKVISADVINHIRIMMEETEHMMSTRIECNKLVFLLLHFPFDLNSKMCYPTIFLHGWDHYYLDSIGGRETTGSVNIVSWLSQCCFDSTHQITSDPFVSIETLRFWINEILPTICAHINIRQLSDWPSRSHITNLSRVDIWKKFLVEMKVGDVLIKRFLSYWTPKKMIDISNKTAVISRTSSSLGMTGIIEAEVYQAFIEFLLYTLAFVNKQHGLHVMFLNSNDPPEKADLFIDLLHHIHLPSKLEHFKACIINYNKPKPSKTASPLRALTFPFFRLVFDLLESILDIAVNDFYEERTNACENTQEAEITIVEIESAFNQQSMITRIVRIMVLKLRRETESTSFLTVALNKLKISGLLWRNYINDAVSKRMDREGSFGCKLLSDYFCKMFNATGDLENKLCALHVNLRFHERESTLSSSLFVVHCIDDISNFHLYKEDSLMKEFESQDLENVPNIFSKVICILFSVIPDILQTDHYEKLKDVSDIYFRLINVITTEDHLKELDQKTVNYWVLIHTCMEVRHAMVTAAKKDEFSTSVEDFMMKYMQAFKYEAQKDTVIKMMDIGDAITAIAFDQTDVVNLMPNPSLPKSLIRTLDALLTLYVTKMKIVFLKDDDFHWLLKLLNVCKDTSLLGILQNYLKCILLNGTKGNEESALGICNPEFRSKIGEFLSLQLTSRDESKKSLVYYPTYYRDCPKVKFGQSALKEPLADAYFQFVIGQLTWEIDSTQTTDFIKLLDIKELNATKSSELPDRLMILIEKEAIVHVIVTQLSRNLKKFGEIELADIGEVIDKVNMALESQHLSISCIKIRGHGILFTLRLLQAFNSIRSFSHMMTTNFSLYLQDFDCLHEVRGFLKSPQISSGQLKLPFVEQIKKKHPEMYKSVYSGIEKILKMKADEGVTKLKQLGTNYYVMGKEKETHEKMKWSFNMMVLIVIIELVFSKKNWSRLLADNVFNHLYEVLETEYLNLMVWFSDPHYFRDKFSDIPDDFHQLETFLIQLIDDSSNQPLMEFLLQLLIVTVGCPKKCSHLWIHIFCPQEISGPLFSTLVGEVNCKEKKYYATAKSLLSFEKLSYTKRNTLNFQSLTFMYLMNYGSLLLSPLANYKTNSSSLISDGQSIMDFSMLNLQKLWNEGISQVLNINDDEKQVLASNFFLQLYEFCINGQFLESFASSDILAYEEKLHSVFLKAWLEKKKIKRYEGLSSNLAQTLRSLESKSVALTFSKQKIQISFLHKILSSTTLQKRSNNLYVLYQFMLQRSVINAGGKVLPYLILCYHFMTDKWSYTLTKEEAREQDIMTFLDNYLSEYFADSKEEVLNLFGNMLSMYASYCTITGAKPLPRKIIDLVSFEGKDGALYESIFVIMRCYNEFIDEMITIGSQIQSLSFMESLDVLPVSEIDTKSCCIGNSLRFSDIDDIFPFIEKHYVNFPTVYPKDVDSSCLTDYITEFFDLEEIQLEIVQNLLIHKRPVDDKKVKKEFRFFRSEKMQGVQRTEHSTSIVNMEMMEVYLRNHEKYLVSLPDEGIAEFKCQFHVLHYNAMLKVFVGLSLLVKYLCQILDYVVDNEGIADFSVKQFIVGHINTQAKDDRVLETISIEKQTAIYYYSGIDEEQYTYLCSIKMKHAFCVVQLLSGWMGSGLYEFCDLPHSMKAELKETVSEEIHFRIKNCGPDPRTTAQALIDILIENEGKIKKEIYQNMESPISSILEVTQRWRGSMTLIVLLEGIQVKHYVYLQITLRTVIANYLSKENDNLQLEQSKIEKTSPTMKQKELSPNAKKDETSTDYRRSLDQSDQTKSQPSSPKFAKARRVLSTDEMIVPDLTQAEKSRMKQNADEITDENFLAFIQTIGLDQSIVDTIEDLQITAAVLYLAMDDDSQLMEIGIDKSYLRLKFKVLFRRFLLGETLRIASEYTIEKVKEFIQNIPRLAVQISQTLEEHGFDGEMLWLADDTVLKELKIEGITKSILKGSFRREVLAYFRGQQ